MSYILDALKKSEQQRDLGRIPTLTDGPPVGAEGSIRKNLPVIGALLLALLAVLLALYAVLNGHFAGSPVPKDSPQVSATGINPEPPETPVWKKAAATPAAVSLPKIGEAEKNEQPLKTAPQTRRAEESAAAETSLPKNMPDTAPPEELVTKTSPAATSDDPPSIARKRIEQPVPTEPPSLNRLELPLNAALPTPPEKTVSTDAVAERSPLPQILPKEKNVKEAKTSQIIAQEPQLPVKKVRRQRPGTEHVLPYEIYRRLPKRKVSALAYSEVQERRFVIVNSRKMREKETTEQGLEVVEIMDDGVIFGFQDHRFFKQLIP